MVLRILTLPTLFSSTARKKNNYDNSILMTVFTLAVAFDSYLQMTA